MSDSESSTDENYAQINQWLDYFADAGIPPQPGTREIRAFRSKLLIVALESENLTKSHSIII